MLNVGLYFIVVEHILRCGWETRYFFVRIELLIELLIFRVFIRGGIVRLVDHFVDHHFTRQQRRGLFIQLVLVLLKLFQ